MSGSNRKSPGNILLVWDRAGDYHAARFLALEKATADHVFLADLGAADGLYLWKNPLEAHPKYYCFSTRKVEESDVWNRFIRFRQCVLSNKIQVVGISGYGRAEYRLMLAWCRLKGIQVVLFAESWYGTNTWVNGLKGTFLRWACRRFLVSGQRAAQHFHMQLEIPNEQIATGYSVVDNAHFDTVTEVEKEKILLCVARFSPEKNLERLISAFQQSELSKAWMLKIVGGGPLKSKLESLITNPERVQLLDWLSYQALPYLYKQASFFILPSTFEPWGLVVNEAMAAGLPVALSSSCGCAPDLADVRNGFIFDAEELDSMIFTLNQIAHLKPMEFDLMGKRSREVIRHFRPEDWANQFLKLLN